MTTSTTCPFCEAILEKRVGRYHYKASGLPYVWLEGVVIRTCPGCEEGGGVEIPNLAGLHTVLTDYLIHQKARFESFEIRFLRKTLGWSSKDFAKRMGVDPATVSRWEAGTAQPCDFRTPNGEIVGAMRHGTYDEATRTWGPLAWPASL